MADEAALRIEVIPNRHHQHSRFRGGVGGQAVQRTIRRHRRYRRGHTLAGPVREDNGRLLAANGDGNRHAGLGMGRGRRRRSSRVFIRRRWRR